MYSFTQDSTSKTALQLLNESSKHLFITGNAGTGKSTLLEYWRSQKQNIAVVAPTGVAALNVKGQTIHSFFGFRPDVTVDKVERFYRNKGKNGLYKKLEAIVIDEISMVRADLLDCIDAFLRLHGRDSYAPFGGVRIIFIGDLYQLPPIVTDQEKNHFSSYYKTPYFFSASVFSQLEIEYVELQKIYRQTDREFIEILNAIRNNTLTQEQLDRINARHDPQFETPSNRFFITLTTTNQKAQAINQHHLNNLFNERHTYSGIQSGVFDTKALPTMPNLELKVGAQVMMVANDKEGRFVNGSLGKITAIERDGKTNDKIFVEFESGEEISVEPYTWEMFKVEYNPATDKLQTQVTGTFKQYPLTLAWAITIHKSQGKTFDNVIIDFGWGTFAHGQAYVALSRCTTLKGIVLTTQFEKEFIITDPTIKKFLSTFTYLKDDGVSQATHDEATVLLLEQAIESRSLVRFTHSQTGVRIIQPQQVIETELSFEGICQSSGKNERFQLNTISQLKILSDIS